MARTAERALIDYALDVLRDLVPRGWTVATEREPLPGASPRDPDAVISLTDAAGERTLVFVETKQTSSPQALARWSDGAVRTRSPWLLVSPKLSPRSKDVLRSAGVNWLDTDGSVSLRLPRVLLEIGSPDARRESERLSSIGHERLAPYVQERPPRPAHVTDLFAGYALRIVRLVLTEPNREWRVKDVAEKAGVSKAWASRVLAALETDAFVEGVPRGPKRLSDPQGLLDAWSEAPRPSQPSIGGVTTESPGMLRERISRLPSDAYAVTGDAAADFVAPFARVAQVELYVDQNVVAVPDVLRALNARETARGANVVILPIEDRAVMDGAETLRTQYGAIRIVSRPQLYVDLKRRGGASSEAAEFLKERGNLWLP